MSSESEFRRLYGAHYEEVHAFCVRRIGRAEADDVVSEVFTAAWRRLDDMDAGVERSWLFGIARNLIRKEWRSGARQSRLLGRIRQKPQQGPEQPDDLAVRRSESNLVVLALATLRRADREILIMAAWDSLSGPEIAQVLGVSTNSVHQRLHRAKRRLATAIEDLGDRRAVETLARGIEQ
jgi:RNA polymerase sigma-70 factor (ECF subfamily)